jgi:hypothetical protein
VPFGKYLLLLIIIKLGPLFEKNKVYNRVMHLLRSPTSREEWQTIGGRWFTLRNFGN